VRSVISALAGLTLVACAAHMVSNPNSAYAPVNAAEHGGEVRYKSNGLLAGKRRENAYKQMYAACSAAYRIDGESDHPGATYTFVNSQTNSAATGTATTTYDVGSATTNASAVGQSNTTGSVITVRSEYRYIHFTCVPGAPAVAADSGKR
jgi:hypothetical protein